MNYQQTSHSVHTDVGIVDGLVKPLVDNLLQRNERLERLAETVAVRPVSVGDELGETRARANQAEAELTQLRDAYNDVQKIYESATKELAVLQDEFIDQKKLLSVARKKLKSKTVEHTDAVRQIHELRAELEKKDSSPTIDNRVEELEAELKSARLALQKSVTVKKSSESPAAVNMASIRRHLSSARRLFDEDPDKSLMSLDRAISLCAADKGSENKEDSDDERAT